MLLLLISAKDLKGECVHSEFSITVRRKVAMKNQHVEKIGL